MGTGTRGVLIIYTGGTIGMIEDPKTGSLMPFNFGALLDFMPELDRFPLEIDVHEFEKPVDSSQITGAHWIQMAAIIEANYSKYEGFVVLHGTDTMAYSASALSFLLENLTKPVIFTGSQLPMGKLRTDGKENLITAIELAGAERNGEAIVQEVCIYFESRLMRGNRCVKYSTEEFDAFQSPNFPHLAEVGIHVFYQHEYLHRSVQKDLEVHSKMNDSVAVLKFVPGMSSHFVQAVLADKNIKGLVLESYGSGNVPNEPKLLEALKKAVNRGMVLVNVTQCLDGFVQQGLYDASRELLEMGILNGADMTTEAASTKLMFLLDKFEDIAAVKTEFVKPYCGELTTFSSWA